jgi:hypothetical protein
MADLRKQNPQAIAIMAGAYLDHALGTLLRAKFRPATREENYNRLSDPLEGGHLSGTDAKIRVAYATWLFGPHCYHDLLVINSIVRTHRLRSGALLQPAPRSALAGKGGEGARPAGGARGRALAGGPHAMYDVQDVSPLARTSSIRIARNLMRIGVIEVAAMKRQGLASVHGTVYLVVALATWHCRGEAYAGCDGRRI